MIAEPVKEPRPDFSFTVTFCDEMKRLMAEHFKQGCKECVAAESGEAEINPKPGRKA